MAVTTLQSLVSRSTQTVAGRVVKTTAYRQPQAILSLPSRSRVRMHSGVMPNRMRGHERLDRVNPDHEAALAVRTGRSAGIASGLPQRLARSAGRISFTGWSRPTGKRWSTSFGPRIELPRPCAWGRRFAA
jgi:hypothetical protein